MMVDRTFHTQAPESSAWLSALRSGQASISGRARRPRLVIDPEVVRALGSRQPVVGLESTIICHGIPRPHNEDLAVEIEDAVRAEGAVPATTAVIEGDLRIGLMRDELVRLARRDDVAKCTTRELPGVLARGATGATTVASTVFIAAMTGIKVTATGGIGGVHRGGETSLDVSADLEELARRPVMVVASGIKVILDVARTLERLETLGVALLGFTTDRLPGFYIRTTGHAIPRADHLDEVARQFAIQRQLGLTGALLVMQPPPGELALDPTEVERLIERSLDDARAAGITGPAETPFVLRRMAELSGSRTERLNRALAIANARLAARLAVRLSATVESPDVFGH